MRVDVEVIGQDLIIPPENEYVVEGTQEFIQFHFILHDGWEDLTIFAQFIQDGTAYNVYLDDDNNAYLPAEIVTGFVRLLLYGTKENTVAVSNYLLIRVRRTRFVRDGQSTEIAQSLYQQLVDRVDSLEQEIEQLIAELQTN